MDRLSPGGSFRERLLCGVPAMKTGSLTVADISAAIVHHALRPLTMTAPGGLSDDVDLGKYLPPVRYPYGTACAIKLRLISLILGMQYRYMPQATTASCRLSQLFKVLRECRNWLPRQLVFGDSWARTLRFP